MGSLQDFSYFLPHLFFNTMCIHIRRQIPLTESLLNFKEKLSVSKSNPLFNIMSGLWSTVSYTGRSGSGRNVLCWGVVGDNVRRNVMAQAMSSHKHRLVEVDQELRFKVWPADSARCPILFHVQVGQTWLVGVVVKVKLVRGYPP